TPSPRIRAATSRVKRAYGSYTFQSPLTDKFLRSAQNVWTKFPSSLRPSFCTKASFSRGIAIASPQLDGLIGFCLASNPFVKLDKEHVLCLARQPQFDSLNARMDSPELFQNLLTSCDRIQVNRNTPH